MSEDVITIAEVAKYLRLNERTVYRLAQDGKVPAVKIAGQWRFRRDVLDEWLADQMRQFVTPPEPPGLGLSPGAELADGSSRSVLVGECKWWKSPVGVNVLRGLRERAARLGDELQRQTRLAVFSLSGFTEELRSVAKREGIVLLSAQRLLRRP